MGLDVTAYTRIQRPRSEVADYVMDPANDRVWIGGIKEARLLGEPPVRVGTRVAREARFLGRRVEYVNEVRELLPHRRLVMESVESPFPMRITYEFAEADGGTEVRTRVEGDASGFYRLGERLMAPLVRRNIQRDVERLKRLLER